MALVPPVYMTHPGISGLWPVQPAAFYAKYVNEGWTLADAPADPSTTPRRLQLVGEPTDGQFPIWDGGQGVFVPTSNLVVTAPDGSKWRLDVAPYYAGGDPVATVVWTLVTPAAEPQSAIGSPGSVWV